MYILKLLVLCSICVSIQSTIIHKGLTINPVNIEGEAAYQDGKQAISELMKRGRFGGFSGGSSGSSSGSSSGGSPGGSPGGSSGSSSGSRGSGGRNGAGVGAGLAAGAAGHKHGNHSTSETSSASSSVLLTNDLFGRFVKLSIPLVLILA